MASSACRAAISSSSRRSSCSICTLDSATRHSRAATYGPTSSRFRNAGGAAGAAGIGAAAGFTGVHPPDVAGDTSTRGASCTGGGGASSFPDVQPAGPGGRLAMPAVFCCTTHSSAASGLLTPRFLAAFQPPSGPMEAAQPDDAPWRGPLGVSTGAFHLGRLMGGDTAPGRPPGGDTAPGRSGRSVGGSGRPRGEMMLEGPTDTDWPRGDTTVRGDTAFLGGIGRGAAVDGSWGGLPDRFAEGSLKPTIPGSSMRPARCWSAEAAEGVVKSTGCGFDLLKTGSSQNIRWLFVMRNSMIFKTRGVCWSEAYESSFGLRRVGPKHVARLGRDILFWSDRSETSLMNASKRFSVAWQGGDTMEKSRRKLSSTTRSASFRSKSSTRGAKRVKGTSGSGSSRRYCFSSPATRWGSCPSNSVSLPESRLSFRESRLLLEGEMRNRPSYPTPFRSK
mmetsp:Transcript_52397/g.131696  ORF Transcript_52397/g.131696 Transcript_52397/m.131696 type:complete len:449 (-) Transcript_52397:1029-2375(-)